MFLIGSLSLLYLNAINSQPLQDECQLVNATEPPQCPQTIGPPCPPCIINSAPAYASGDPLTINTSTRALIQFYMNEYLNYWLQNYPPSMVIPANDATSIYKGATGRALIFLRMYNYTNNQTHLNIAAQYMRNTMNNMNTTLLTPAYIAGYGGIYIVAAQLAQMQNKQNETLKYLVDLRGIFEDVDTAIQRNDNYSPKYKFNMQEGNLFTGLSGLLYTGILTNQYFGRDTIDDQYIVNLAHYIINLGLQISAAYNKTYMLFTFSNSGCLLPGSAEGSGGVVKILLEAYNKGYISDLMSNKTYFDAITNTLDWFVDLQLSDGNIPTYSNDSFGKMCINDYGSDNDARVQWCHGAPGFIDTLSLSSVIYDSINKTNAAETYLTAALKAYNSTWTRGLLIKGLMQCHGIGGNAYLLLHIYKNLKLIAESGSAEIKNKFNIPFLMNQSLWRTIKFVEFTLDENNLNALRTKYSDEDYSTWLGSYGMPLLYIQSIQPGWPAQQPVCMVAWDFCGV